MWLCRLAVLCSTIAPTGSVLAGLVGRYAVDWRTAGLHAGDVVVLGLGTYHMTARNISNEARLSCDTRWCMPVRVLGLGLGVYDRVPVQGRMVGSTLSCRGRVALCCRRPGVSRTSC